MAYGRAVTAASLMCWWKRTESIPFSTKCGAHPRDLTAAIRVDYPYLKLLDLAEQKIMNEGVEKSQRSTALRKWGNHEGPTATSQSRVLAVSRTQQKQLSRFWNSKHYGQVNPW